VNEEILADWGESLEELKFDLDKLYPAVQTGLNTAVNAAIPDVVDFVLGHLYKQLFKGQLRGMIYEVTGNGPFQSIDLFGWFDKFGLYWSGDTEPPNLGYIVIGREYFEEEYLKDALETNYSIHTSFIYEFYSQEDFINFWLFGVEANYYPGDPRIESHPGLTYLASLGDYPWPWPSTDDEPGSGGYLNEYYMQEKHPLLERFGYTVSAKERLTQRERRKRLDTALTVQHNPLSLQEVVEHIAYLIKRSKRRHDNKMVQAIIKWEKDLDYLHQKYYKKQFRWPSL
jgi:hypothetical protein